jgi:phage N-6-adenine-methyltransferase
MNPALNSSVKMDWQTPDSLLDLVRQVGPIDLDPCTVMENPTRAKFFCTPENDGLSKPWTEMARGLIYVNPPYGRELPEWVAKCVAEAEARAEIVLLTPARPDTRWFQTAASRTGTATVLFWKGRIKFRGAPASAPFPSAIFYWGPRPERFREVFAGKGLFL